MNLPSACAIALALAAGTAGAQSYRWETFAPNQAYYTIIPQGINNANQVTGVWDDVPDSDHGFIVQLGAGGNTFQSFDAPQSSGGKVMAVRGTWAGGIDDAGTIVGVYTADGTQHGFVRDASGTFTTLDIAGHRHTALAGINDAGQMIVLTSDTDVVGDDRSFLRSPGGTLTPIAMPGSLRTYADGIDASGRIVGSYDAADGSSHGYLRSAVGVFQTVDVAGADATFASGLNAGGWIAGEYDVGSIGHAFVRDPAGTVTVVDPPGAVYAAAFGINDAGWVVGQSCDAAGVCSGFVAAPVPGPPSTAVWGAGLAVLGLLLQRRRAVASGFDVGALAP